MSRNPLVSIVLPTYNGSRYLAQAVQSCLEQTYPNWELIIVDDGSTDNTPALIAQFTAIDSRIRSICHEMNRGLPGALNTGFSLAKGDYLTWTSDDNCYRPQALSKMVEFLESNPEVDIVYTNFTIIDEAGNPVRLVIVPGIETLIFKNCVGPSFLYRRRVQETLKGYAEDLFLAEDYDFWLRASVLFRFQPLHEDLYLYRRHSGSLSMVHARNAYRVAYEALKRNLPQLNWIDNKTRAESYLRIAAAEQNFGHPKEAYRCLFRAVTYSPTILKDRKMLGPFLHALFGEKGFRIVRYFYRKAPSLPMIGGLWYTVQGREDPES
jgi:glycosyltransferase involved in cell wall biosynthesis